MMQQRTRKHIQLFQTIWYQALLISLNLCYFLKFYFINEYLIVGYWEYELTNLIDLQNFDNKLRINSLINSNSVKDLYG